MDNIEIEIADVTSRTMRMGGKIFETKRSLPEFALSGQNIHKSYTEGGKTLEVLRGINFEIKSGEIIAIMGPSGAGKSTLLHILGLMDEPTDGNLAVLGWTANRMNDQEKDNLRNKYIGFLFQFHYLLPDFTLLENTALPLRIQGFKDSHAKDISTELLEAVGLKERMSHFPSQVSGGEQQRAALARAMVHKPALLICDEPTGNLDLERGEEIRDLIWRIARSKGSTVLVATHNPDIAKNADRIIKIVDGKIV